jgi:hypothetical protein
MREARSTCSMQAGGTDTQAMDEPIVANLKRPSAAGRSAAWPQDRVDYRRRIALWGTIAFASLSVIGMFAQVYLIAGVLFGEDWLELHRDLGKLVHLGYLLTFGAALLAAPQWRWLLLPSVLAMLGSTQAFLAGEFDIPLLGWGIDIAGDNDALHALHGALVPIVFAVALGIVWQAWTALRGRADVVAHRVAGVADGRGWARPAPARSASMTGATVSEREQRRWLVALLGPLLVASAFLCATFATTGGADWAYWLFTPTVLLAPTWVLTLVYLASTSDAYVASEREANLAVPSAKQAADREAA